MALANAVQGATRPNQSITWTRADDTAEVLTGATLTGVIRDAAGTVRAVTGTLTVTDGTNGVFSWAYSVADVATAGRFEVQFTATFAADPTPARTLATSWEVKPAYTVAS